MSGGQANRERFFILCCPNLRKLTPNVKEFNVLFISLLSFVHLDLLRSIHDQVISTIFRIFIPKEMLGMQKRGHFFVRGMPGNNPHSHPTTLPGLPARVPARPDL